LLVNRFRVILLSYGISKIADNMDTHWR